MTKEELSCWNPDMSKNLLTRHSGSRREEIGRDWQQQLYDGRNCQQLICNYCCCFVTQITKQTTVDIATARLSSALPNWLTVTSKVLSCELNKPFHKLPHVKCSQYPFSFVQVVTNCQKLSQVVTSCHKPKGSVVALTWKPLDMISSVRRAGFELLFSFSDSTRLVFSSLFAISPTSTSWSSSPFWMFSLSDKFDLCSLSLSVLLSSSSPSSEAEIMSWQIPT